MWSCAGAEEHVCSSKRCIISPGCSSSPCLAGCSNRTRLQEPAWTHRGGFMLGITTAALDRKGGRFRQPDTMAERRCCRDWTGWASSIDPEVEAHWGRVEEEPPH